MNTIKVKMLETKLWAQENPALNPVLYKKDTVNDVPETIGLSMIRQRFAVKINEEVLKEDVVKTDKNQKEEKMETETKKQNKMMTARRKNKKK